jgi:DNA adenine methylase
MKKKVFKAPWPYFGGKSTIARETWQRFGDVPSYIEPFFGSGAVLLGRPGWRPDVPWIEKVNDKSGFVSNFWRAVAADPEQVAHYALWPVFENDLHARHIWLVHQKEDLVEKLEGDPDWYDAKVAGWWGWVASLHWGGELCAGKGPWKRIEKDGQKRLVRASNSGEPGIRRSIFDSAGSGRGLARWSVYLGNIHAVDNNDNMEFAGDGKAGTIKWLQALSHRLCRVQVACGDWKRILTPMSLYCHGLSAIFLDPPYSMLAKRNKGLYEQDDLYVAYAVRQWCIQNGNDPSLRIALAGYRGEGHEILEEGGWTTHNWKARGGYTGYARSAENRRGNRRRETIWFSPHCLPEPQLFPDLASSTNKE